jgi:hypothetical protein
LEPEINQQTRRPDFAAQRHRPPGLSQTHGVDTIGIVSVRRDDRKLPRYAAGRQSEAVDQRFDGDPRRVRGGQMASSRQAG